MQRRQRGTPDCRSVEKGFDVCAFAACCAGYIQCLLEIQPCAHLSVVLLLAQVQSPVADALAAPATDMQICIQA